MKSFPVLNEIKSYEDVARSVTDAREVLESFGVRVSNSSILHKIFQDTIKVAGAWEENRDKVNIKMAMSLLHADIICSAVINLKDDPQLKVPLLRIAKSDMNLSGRASSQGKDVLWELMLLNSMRKASVTGFLLDPPDIVADLEFGKYSIACKKVYSDNNVGNQLRVGVRQVVESGNKGIVAFSLDELTPGDSILSLASASASMRRLSNFNDEFISRHRLDFQGYVKAKKIDGILVSTTVPADITTDARRLNNITQYTFWTLTGKTKGYSRLEGFVERLSVRPTAS
ncbi:hypothetical protein HX785_02205 [Pseudomonas reactans]|uniref:hypothetical protein n=1 Tax=Pseudomonas reactans TaxID=117680 RepID=UPI00159FE254|nr:hypothetical protein [Pseudomonas reactans]NWF12484.1 hypothetical protein [Pseudomonas reactans]